MSIQPVWLPQGDMSGEVRKLPDQPSPHNNKQTNETNANKQTSQQAKEIKSHTELHVLSIWSSLPLALHATQLTAELQCANQTQTYSTT